MRLVGTGEIGTDPISQLIGREQASWLNYCPFAMDPLGFDGIEPGTLDRQLAHQQTDSRPGAFDRLVMRTHPGAYRLANVPGGVVPDQDPDRDALLLQSGATPVQKLDGTGADRATLDKAQPDRFLRLLGLCQALRAQQDARAGQRFRIGIGSGDPLFHQTQRVVD